MKVRWMSNGLRSFTTICNGGITAHITTTLRTTLQWCDCGTVARNVANYATTMWLQRCNSQWCELHCNDAITMLQRCGYGVTIRNVIVLWRCDAATHVATVTLLCYNGRWCYATLCDGGCRRLNFYLFIFDNHHRRAHFYVWKRERKKKRKKKRGNFETYSRILTLLVGMNVTTQVPSGNNASSLGQ